MFDKKENYEVDYEVGNRLLIEKKAELVSVSPDRSKMVIRAKRGIVAEKDESQTHTQEEVAREKVPGKIAYEIVREKDSRNVVMKKGKVGKKVEFIDFKRRRFYLNHIIKERVGKRVRYFVRWNFYNSEAYDSTGAITYDDSLEMNLMNDQMGQLGKAVMAVVGFTLERPIVYLLIIAFAVAIPIGLSLFPSLFNPPNTVVHWVAGK